MKQLVLLDKVDHAGLLSNTYCNSRSISTLNYGIGVSLPVRLRDGSTSGWYYASHELQKLLRRS